MDRRLRHWLRCHGELRAMSLDGGHVGHMCETWVFFFGIKQQNTGGHMASFRGLPLFFWQGYTLGIPAGIGLGAGGIWRALQIQAVPGESYKEAPTRHGQNGLVFVAKMAWSGMTFREYRRLGRAKVARWLRQNGMVAAPAWSHWTGRRRVGTGASLPHDGFFFFGLWTRPTQGVGLFGQAGWKVFFFGSNRMVVGYRHLLVASLFFFCIFWVHTGGPRWGCQRQGISRPGGRVHLWLWIRLGG